MIDNSGLGEVRSDWNLVGVFCCCFLLREGQVEMAGPAGGCGCGLGRKTGGQRSLRLEQLTERVEVPFAEKVLGGAGFQGGLGV